MTRMERYDAHIATIATELSGLCDTYGFKRPQKPFIQAALNYIEINSMLTADSLRPLFPWICETCMLQNIELPQIFGLVVAGSLVGWSAEALLKDFVDAVDESTGNMQFAEIVGRHPVVRDLERTHTAELWRFWNMNTEN